MPIKFILPRRSSFWTQKMATKPAMNFSFDNQTSPITTQFTRELPQLRDTSRLQRAAGQEYERSFRLKGPRAPFEPGHRSV